MNMPNGWKSATLGELIPEKVCKRVERILNRYAKGKLESPEIHKELVDTLMPHKDELEKKGVLVDYLAYAIENVGNQMREARRAKDAQAN